jgi:transcriptional regulator with XRE-family HTH domain
MQMHTPYEEPRSLLERVRLARGLSRARLAAEAEVSPRAIAYAEREGVQPRRATARALAAVLGIDPAWLLTADDEAPAGNGRQVTTSAGAGDGHDEL